MPKPRESPDEPARDVLAAEEFVLPAPDPVLQERRGSDPHDVLAAEEFGVGVADPALHHGPLELPEDPSGISAPHDVLAAEEFALPAPPPGGAAPPRSGWRSPGPAAAVAGLAVIWSVRRRRTR
jgi:hypothetical protein